MLLAVDIPVLRPTVSAAMIRMRRRLAIWRTTRARRRAAALRAGRLGSALRSGEK
jgi:hypothetical protein